MLCDPQTSGGLLIACSDEAVPQVLDLLARRGFEYGSVIGGFLERPTCAGGRHWSSWLTEDFAVGER
jgi:hypothetical protein